MKLTDFPYALHFGILNCKGDFGSTTRFKSERLIPKEPTSDTGNGSYYLIANGDSYLTWGKTGPDRTAHLIIGLAGVEMVHEVSDIAEAVWDFITSAVLGANEYMRLVDYAVVTDSDDWGSLDGDEDCPMLVSTLRPVM